MNEPPLLSRPPAAVCAIVGALGIAAAVYLTWRPSGTLKTVPGMPRPIGDWLDGHGRFRNFPAYAVLALPFQFLRSGSSARRRWTAGLAGAAVVLEAFQVFLPQRHCEWQDVAWSWAGLAATWAVCELVLRPRELRS